MRKLQTQNTIALTCFDFGKFKLSSGMQSRHQYTRWILNCRLLYYTNHYSQNSSSIPIKGELMNSLTDDDVYFQDHEGYSKVRTNSAVHIRVYKKPVSEVNSEEISKNVT